MKSITLNIQTVSSPPVQACLPLARFPVGLAPALGSRSDSYVQDSLLPFLQVRDSAVL